MLILIGNKKEMVRIMLEECVSSKLDLNFSKIKYNDLVKKDLDILERGIFALDDTGFVLYVPFDNNLLNTVLKVKME